MPKICIGVKEVTAALLIATPCTLAGELGGISPVEQGRWAYLSPYLRRLFA